MIRSGAMFLPIYASIAALAVSGSKLANDLPDVAGKAFNFLTAKGDVHLITFIPLTGNGVYDNVLSWGTWLGFEATSLISGLQSGSGWITGAASSAKSIIEGSGFGFLNEAGRVIRGPYRNMTWHHNEIMGLMELIVSSNNHGAGSQSHVGGAKFWSIINDKPYEGIKESTLFD